MPLSAKIRERVRREFFPEDYHAACRMLLAWSTKGCAPGERPQRMHNAMVNLARGNLANLKSAITAAQEDYRDVLWWGDTGEKQFIHLRAVACEADDPSQDPTERAFLDAIRDDPSDNTARLVYADLLEDRDDPRSDYIRVLCQWLNCDESQEPDLISRERELRTPHSPRWLAEIRGMPVIEGAKK